MITENASGQAQHNRGGRRLKQVKVSVAADVAAAFKGACAASNVSMASELSKFMAGYSKAAPAKRKPPQDYSTKRQRRAAVRKVALALEQVRDCEERYLERIPENLRNSAAFDNAEEFISYLDTAIDSLESIDSI